MRPVRTLAGAAVRADESVSSLLAPASNTKNNDNQ